MNQAIRTFNLTKCYPKSQGWGQILSWGELDTPAVDGVSLDVYQGELFGLLGPNGAGKTTLIKMLATLIQPNGGTAWVNGFPLHNEAAIKASIGLVTSDERSFYWRLTGFQNLSFFASLHGLSPTLVNERARDMLERVGLTKVADKRFQTYSTGMRQRLSIARSLLNKPRILFLDEPTRGLDPTATKAIHELILDELIDQQGLTVFLTTHYLGEAESLCNRIAIMDHGRIQACGTVNELRGTLALNHHYQIQVAGTRPDIQKALTNSAKDSGFNFRYDRNIAGGDTVSDINYKEHVPGETTRITFTTLGGDKALNRVIDSLRQNRVDILDITNQAPSLMDIFAAIVNDEQDPLLETPHSWQNPPPSSDATAYKNGIEPQGNYKGGAADFSPRIAFAFLKRDWFSEVSYRFSFILQFLNIFFTAGVFYFIAQLLGEAAAPYLQAYGGDYFSFVLIGIALGGYFGVGLSSFSNRLRQAQTTGTLEAMLTTPASLSAIVLSSSLWDYLLTTLRVGVYLAFGVVILGMQMRQSNLLAALIILFFTIIAFSSLGIIAASFIMVLKRGDPITWAFSAVSSLVGGVYFPVDLLPGPLVWISRLLPITYSLEAMRLALLQGTPTAELLPEIAALLIFSLLLLPLSLFSFRYAVRKAKRDGSLTQY